MSMDYTFGKANNNAPSTRAAQYFEMLNFELEPSQLSEVEKKAAAKAMTTAHELGREGPKLRETASG